MESKWRQVIKPGVGIKGGVHGKLSLDTRYGTKVPELKFVDFTSNSNFATSAGPPTGTCLNLCVQGTGPFNRIGQRIQMKSIRLTGWVSPIATTTGYGGGRILIIYDRQSNAALPGWTDVVSNIDQGGNVNTGVYANINLANRERFIVLADERYNFSAQSVSGGLITSADGQITATEKNPVMMNFDRYIMLRGLETHYNQTNGGTYADIQTGSIVMFVVGDSTTNNAFKFTYWGRIRYQDL